MKPTISFLTQEETKRLFAAIPSKRDRVIFLTACRLEQATLKKRAFLAVLYSVHGSTSVGRIAGGEFCLASSLAAPSLYLPPYRELPGIALPAPGRSPSWGY